MIHAGDEFYGDDVTAGVLVDETFTAGMTWSLHTTGVTDRRDSNTTSRLRAGRAIGRRKKERIAGRDV